jgi:hypothetical protein
LIFIALCSLFAIFGDAMGFEATSVSVLVLNAKGEKVKAKSTGSAGTCEFQKVLCFEPVFLIKTLLIAKMSFLIAKLFLIGRNLSYGKM